jgi:hypothetical protein
MRGCSRDIHGCSPTRLEAELPDSASDGAALPLEDARGRFLGMGIVNTQSQIVWRRFSTREASLGTGFFPEGP